MNGRRSFEAEEAAFHAANEPAFTVSIKHAFKGVAMSTMVARRNIAAVVDRWVDEQMLPENQNDPPVTIAINMTGWVPRRDAS